VNWNPGTLKAGAGQKVMDGIGLASMFKLCIPTTIVVDFIVYFDQTSDIKMQNSTKQEKKMEVKSSFFITGCAILWHIFTFHELMVKMMKYIRIPMNNLH
jgi:hypothetical protein